MAAAMPGAGRAAIQSWRDPAADADEVPLGAGAVSGWSSAATDPVAGLAMVGDIRLDRRAELAAALGEAPRGEATDAELVLAAYRRWGDRCAEHLVGDFAFAVWDGRRRRVLCARDPFATKPLYYFLSPSIIAAASDPEALLALPGVPRRLNPLAVAQYLCACYEDKEATPYFDVARLVPGSTMVVDDGAVRRWRHWHPDAVPDLDLGSDAAYEEAFRVALGDAVEARLGPGRIGVYLSGGLDSSSVTCMAQPRYDNRLLTFSAVFDHEPRSDEREYAAAAAAHAGAEAHLCRPEHTSPLADGIGAPWDTPGPGLDTHVAVSRAVTASAQERGISALLSGYGGDSVVSHGVAYLTELVGAGRFVRFGVEARALARRHHRSRRGIIRRYGVLPFLPPAVAGRTGAPSPWETRPVRPAVARTLELGERLADLGVGARPRTARQANLREITSGQPVYALEAAYRSDAVAGVERRYPFLDRRLAELCLGLPGDQRLRDGWTRSIVRRALVGVLPEVVRLRPGKTDLTFGFQRGLLGADRPALDALAAHPGPISEWVEPAYLSALWQRCLTERGERDCYEVWRIAAASRWLARNGFA